MLTVSENVRLAGETGSSRPMVKTALLTRMYGPAARCKMRVPTKPAMHSNSKPAGYSDLKPATRGVVRMGQFHDVVEGWEGQETG